MYVNSLENLYIMHHKHFSILVFHNSQVNPTIILIKEMFNKVRDAKLSYSRLSPNNNFV